MTTERTHDLQFDKGTIYIVYFHTHVHVHIGRRSGSVVECLTRDRGAAGSSLTSVTALWSLSKQIYPSLVLVQPRKTRPCLTERLLMGRKVSKQTNKHVHIEKMGNLSKSKIKLYIYDNKLRSCAQFAPRGKCAPGC